MEQVARVKDVVGCGGGIVSFPGATQTERVMDHEQTSRRQFCWRSKDSEA